MSRIRRLWKYRVIWFVTLLGVIGTIKWIHWQGESEQEFVNAKLPHVREDRPKDAVFDKEALQNANPSKDKVLVMAESNPFLSEDGQRHWRHPIIPHIIHQVWDNHKVPRTFVPWIQSWHKQHPTWEYWFWTPQAVVCLLDKQYPTYSMLYEAYPDAISRADAMRYFVLNQYGGVYIDLDTFSFKPMDPWTYNHQCILSEEPHEHIYLVLERNQSNIVNSPMACRPKHPFFQQAIRALPKFAGKYFGDFLRSTGPYFLDAVYKNFTNRDTDPQDNITVVPSRYFLPTFDPSQSGIIDSKCNIHTYRDLPTLQRQVCDKLIDRDYQNKPYPDSFMDHYWFHVNTMDNSWKFKDTVDISDIIPNAKKMSSILCD